MKWFVKRDLYEGEVLPTARVAFVTRIDGEKRILARYIVLRLPFKRWKKHIDPHTFMHDEGWCKYRCMYGYSYTRKQWTSCGVWVPILPEEV